MKTDILNAKILTREKKKYEDRDSRTSSTNTENGSLSRKDLEENFDGHIPIKILDNLFSLYNT